MVHYRVYVDRRKKLKDKRGRNFGFPFKHGDFPLETTKTSFFDGLVYEEHVQRHQPNPVKKFPRFVEVIPWHHARYHIFQAYFSIL
jgi:hypothetical protein